MFNIKAGSPLHRLKPWMHECLKTRRKTMDALKLISQSSMKADSPKLQVGDYVRVSVKIREGDKERLQAFE